MGAVDWRGHRLAAHASQTVAPRRDSTDCSNALNADGNFESVARVAGVATVRSQQRAPDLAAFAERAGIAQYDGGLTRTEAERLAAAEQGFADPEDLYRAVVHGWERGLKTLHRESDDPRVHAILASARAFWKAGLALQAARRGWDAEALLGIDVDDIYRKDSMGLIIFMSLYRYDIDMEYEKYIGAQFTVSHISEDEARLATPSGLRWRFARPPLGAVATAKTMHAVARPGPGGPPNVRPVWELLPLPAW